MKRYIGILMVLLLLVAGCTVTRQTLIRELQSNPNTELASAAVEFFRDYEQKPATKIAMRYEDETVITIEDPILISRFYRYINQITVKSKTTADKVSGEVIQARLSNDNLSVPFEFIGDYLVWGYVAYELGDASKLLKLAREIRSESTPAHTKEYDSYKAHIDSLVNVNETLTADVQFTNTSEENVTVLEATVIFIDADGKIMATKKISYTPDNPLEPEQSAWVAVSCDFQEAIEDVTFQE